jgi:hypothetical protein
MLATHKFETASGHTVEATATAAGYDFHTRNAQGETISTVAHSRIAAEILIAELSAAQPKPRARRKVAAK